jgi:2-amino-4-hydroxy-6-hydroxymethyldihydropteridine diphosphokinase
MDCYIALGTNLGELRENLASGLEGLSARDLAPRAVSSVWETEPVDTPWPQWFWNMAVAVRSDRSPHELLETLLEIESERGRRRVSRNAPRTLDLDLLMVGDLRVDSERLILPHPRMWERRFVLEPLAEIAPQLRNPANGRTVEQERLRIREHHQVRRLGDLATCPARTL